MCVCLRSRLICETGNIPYHNDRLAGPCKHTRFDPVERENLITQVIQIESGKSLVFLIDVR